MSLEELTELGIEDPQVQIEWIRRWNRIVMSLPVSSREAVQR